MNSQPTVKRKFYPPRISLRELKYQLRAARFSLATMLIGVTLFCIFCGFVRLYTYSIGATDVTSEEANRRFGRAWSFVRVPENAAHVNLYARYLSGSADFDISEKGFQTWCKERGWTLTES